MEYVVIPPVPVVFVELDLDGSFEVVEDVSVVVDVVDVGAGEVLVVVGEVVVVEVLDLADVVVVILLLVVVVLVVVVVDVVVVVVVEVLVVLGRRVVKAVALETPSIFSTRLRPLFASIHPD